MTKGEQIKQWVTKHPPTLGSRGYYARVAKRFDSTPESVRTVVKNMKDIPNIVDNVQAKRTKKMMNKSLSQIELGGKVYNEKELKKLIKTNSTKSKYGFEIPKSRKFKIEHTTIKPGNFKIGIINDVHFPYHDVQNLEIALDNLIKAGVDKIILNGDIVDFYSISRFSRKPDGPLIKEELEMAINCLNQVRANFPDAEIYYKCGNHENRLYRYLTERAAGLFGLEQLSLPSLLDLDRNNIKFIDDMEFIFVGDLTIMHGHELGVSTSGANVAYTMYRKYLGSCTFGHFHKTQDMYRTIATGKTQQAHAVGALCDLNPEYRPYNDWNAGFAIVEFDSTGEYLFNNFRISNGKVLNVWPH